MPNVSLNAFLKILSKSSPQKTTEYGRYLTKGGYDFYWMLKEAVRARTLGGENLAASSKPIEDIDRPIEKKHNLGALKSFDKWLSTQLIDGFFDPPTAICISPEQFLKVKLEPAFGFTHGGKRRILHIWASSSLALPKSVVGCGLYLMRENLCTAGFEDCAPAIIDLRNRAIFTADALPASVGAMVASELAWADGFFKASAKAA